MRIELPFSITFREVDRWPLLAFDDSEKVLYMGCSANAANRATLERAMAAAYNGSRLILPDGVKEPRRWETLQLFLRPAYLGCCLATGHMCTRFLRLGGTVPRGFVIGAAGPLYEEFLRVLAERYNRFAEIRNRRSVRRCPRGAA